jgi:uncharacterized protein (TIGR02147 family)
MSPSGLVDFMKGRCGLSETRAQNVAQTLNWSEARYEHFWDLIQSRFSKNTVQKKLAHQRAKKRLRRTGSRLSSDSFAVISEWYHLAILEYCQIHATQNLFQMATDLRISHEAARTAVARMKRLGLMEKSDRGWIPAQGETHIGDEESSEAVRQFHAQMLQKAQQNLEEVSMEERTNVSIVFSIPRQHLPKVKAEIRSAAMEILMKYVETGAPETIQALTLHLFPIYDQKQREDQT